MITYRTQVTPEINTSSFTKNFNDLLRRDQHSDVEQLADLRMAPILSRSILHAVIPNYPACTSRLLP